jgi:osmotically-inducible protein OsmY
MSIKSVKRSLLPKAFKPMFIIGVILTFIMTPTQSTVEAAKRPITDMAISDAVEDELYFDPGVASSQIDVETHNGIVTLKGTVNNILSRDRATRIVETVKGVRAVVNLIKVKPSIFRSDAEIRDDVMDALLFDPAADSYEIKVSVADNVATLRGTVDSLQERELAERVAKGVKGVVDVENQISVVFDMNRPDAEIEAEIEEALRWNTLVDNYLINVTVNDGEVRLDGVVGSASEKNHARVTAWVAGVTSVDGSGIKVKKWARDKDLRKDKYVVKSEAALRRAIQKALLHDPRVFAFDIQVDVIDARVILRGLVDNLKAKRAAEQDAQNTVGVSFVENRIKIRSKAALIDKKVAERIRAALFRDPYVERYEIGVRVLNGIAYLNGTVDTFFEKYHAEDVTSRVRGVIAVRNNMFVDYPSVPLYDPYVDGWYYPHVSIPFEQGHRYYLGKTDAQIEEEIKEELWWSPFVNLEDVEVTVEDGIATLSGDVDSWVEYNAAIENAYEGGAIRVRQKMKITN